jgi:sec-independent protein translocase protein TatA
MNAMLAAFGLSGGELMLVVVAVLILFGSKKIPDFARGLGQGIKEFKKASREVQDEIERAGQETYTPPPESRPASATTPPAEGSPSSSPEAKS